jgi:tRNA(fMet)-specific endonuclease VapC
MEPKKYLLDTNIWIYFLNGQYNLDRKIAEIGFQNCYVSIITVGELLYGAANSGKVEENMAKTNELISHLQVISLAKVMVIYAAQKANLRKIGRLVSDFDILIGATAIAHKMVLVTRNVKDFENMQGLEIENWINSIP